MTSLYSKSPHSPGFNTTLKKFHEMICKIIFSKKFGCSEFSRFLFVCVLITILLRRKKDLAGKTFILKTNFKRLGVFFYGWKYTNLSFIVLHKKIVSYFFEVHCNRILKACFKKLLDTLIRKGDFTLLNKSLERYKLT